MKGEDEKIAVMKERLELEYREKEEEMRRKLESEYDKKLEETRKKFEERESLLTGKVELESKKREDVIRDMYDLKLKREEERLRKELGNEFRIKFEEKLRREGFGSRTCLLKKGSSNLCYPFMAIVGQETMKKALILNAINPGIGGVLLWGERGVGKTTALKGIGEMFPEPENVECMLKKSNPNCQECEKRYEEGAIETERFSVYFIIDNPLNSAAVSIDTMGNERFAHPSKIVVSMKPGEEKAVSKLMLFNKMPLQVEVKGLKDAEQRMEILRRQKEFKVETKNFRKKFEKSQNVLFQRVKKAKMIQPLVTIPDELIRAIIKVCGDMNIESHAVEGLIEGVARTQSAYEGRHRVTVDDVVEATNLSLMHSWGVSEKERISSDQLEALVRMHSKR
jgi:magnesium chelatase subunit I